MSHYRHRKFNTKDTYPEQNLGCPSRAPFLLDCAALNLKAGTV
jgi:hypothetical protein